MVKTFQLAHDGPYGSSIKLSPVTTETESNKETCLKVNGSEELAFTPQTIVPDTTGMEVIYLFIQPVSTIVLNCGALENSSLYLQVKNFPNSA